MFLVPYNLIVVGVTDKPFDYQLLQTIPPFMDLEEKELTSTTDEGKSKFESRNNNEPVVQIFKTSESHILPSVHSSVAAASPIFSSYRSVFQNWKHSVPKLYKYPSSDIEVVVYRKNGEVEKLSNHTSIVAAQDPKESPPSGENGVAIGGSFPDDRSETAIPTPSEVNTEECVTHKSFESASHPATTENGGNFNEMSFESFTNHSACKKSESELTLVPFKTQQEQPSTSSSIPAYPQVTSSTRVAECPKNSKDIKLSTTASNEDTSVFQSVSYDFDGQYSHFNSKKLRQNCEFIFKARLSIVPFAQRLQTNFKENSAQTTGTSLKITRTESKATQVSSHELLAFTRKHAENQCDIGQVKFLANSTQTDIKIPDNVVDFSQIFPVVSNVAIQTDELQNMVVSSSAQSIDSKTENLDLNQIFQTVEWHTNVPCCNASSQMDPYILNLFKENFCQAVPELTSRSSQVENLVESLKSEATTNTDLETKDVEIQLSGSCCYFTKKKTMKQYEMKLEKLRKEIRSFYQNKQSHLDQHDTSGGRKDGNIYNQGEPHCSSWAGSSKYSESGNGETSQKTLDEATKCLDELGVEVDKLLGNAAILKNNLESLEDASYYEDEWLLSN